MDSTNLLIKINSTAALITIVAVPIIYKKHIKEVY